MTKPMRQHNAKVEADTKDLGQQLILLRETNKSLTDRVRALREEKAKMQLSASTLANWFIELLQA